MIEHDLAEIVRAAVAPLAAELRLLRTEVELFSQAMPPVVAENSVRVNFGSHRRLSVAKIPARAEIVDGSGRARQPRPPMLRLAAVVIRWLGSFGRSRRELLLENIALRQQLATMIQKGRPRIRPPIVSSGSPFGMSGRTGQRSSSL